MSRLLQRIQWEKLVKSFCLTLLGIGLVLIGIGHFGLGWLSNFAQRFAGVTAQYLVHDRHLIIPIKFTDGISFSKNATLVQEPYDQQWILIDQAGKPISAQKFSSVEPREAYKIRALVSGNNRKYYFSDGKLNPMTFGNKWGSRFCDGREHVIGLQNGKSGFITETGKWVTDGGIYDAATNFSEGMAAVRVKQKWGYIDLNGKMVIPPQFSDAGPFTGGYASVSNGGNAAITIDRSGKISDMPIRDIDLPRNRKAWVWDSTLNKYGLKDDQGKWLIAPKYDEIYVSRNRFTDTWTATWVRSGKQWGWLNNEGKVSIPLRTAKDYEKAISKWPSSRSDNEVNGGIAVHASGHVFSTGDRPTDDLVAILDRHGNQITDFTFVEAHDEIDRDIYIASAVYSNLKLGCRSQYQPVYDDASVVVGAGSPIQFGYVFLDTKKTIPPTFSRANAFTEGMAAVYMNTAPVGFLSPIFPTKCGYIDKDGNFLIKPKFDQCLASIDGMAMVKVGDRIGYVKNPLRHD
jgi:hypothetical protein